MVTVTLPLVLF